MSINKNFNNKKPEKGNQKKNIVVFINLNSNHLESLSHLREAFHLKGCETKIYSPPLWSEQECSFCEIRSSALEEIGRIKKEEYNIYLVGFSLGGSLAIDIASELDLSGILAINPFFKPTYKWLPLYWFEVNTKVPAGHLIYNNIYFPVIDKKKVVKDYIGLACKSYLSRCPILIIHSTDDKVSSFSESAKIVKLSAREDIRIVPVHGLSHFMQFDISPYVLIDLFFEFSEIKNKKVEIDPVLFESIYSEHQKESRHWSGIVFQIIIGFFTVFGTLLAFTLPDVLQSFWAESIIQSGDKIFSDEELVKHKIAVSGAPYYLTSYSVIISIYLILVSLYFFYLNRIDNFIRIHIEPLHDFPPRIQLRIQSVASGKISRLMTNLISIPIILTPLLTSIGLLVSVYIIFPDRLFSMESRNFFLSVFYIFSIIFLFLSIWSVVKLQIYTSTVSYGVPAPINTTISIEKAVVRLYSSFNKGAYYYLK